MYGTRKDPNSQSNPEKKTRAGGITIPDFKMYYKAVIIKTVWNWHKKQTLRSMEQEKPEMDPQTYGQLIFGQERISNGIKTVSSASGAGKTGQRYAEK